MKHHFDMREAVQPGQRLFPETGIQHDPGGLGIPRIICGLGPPAFDPAHRLHPDQPALQSRIR